MSLRLRYVTPIMSALILLFTSLYAVADVSSAQPAKLALLIGIDNYKAPEIRPLRGAVNDVRLMRELLVGKFGMAPENIKMLENEQATHKAIVDAIKKHLIAKANKGDVVVVHFSGHGSQMPDNSGDEVDQLDETLVPYDSRTEGIFDISDDEINGLLRELASKTKNITFIFDSCHSGASARGGNAVRQIEVDRRAPPSPPDYVVSVRGGEGDADFRPTNSDYVLISGSLAKELSNETEFEGRRHGALTWFLASALRAAPVRASYRAIMDQVKTEVSTLFPSQHPQIEGPGQDLVVFGVDKINVTPYVLVEPIQRGRVRVEAGRALGLGKGSSLKVYAPGTTDFEKTMPTASLKLTTVSDFEAEADVIDGGPIQAHSRTVLDAVTFGDTSIPIFVDTKQSAQLEKVKQVLSEMQAIVLTQDEKGARLVIQERDGKLWIHSGDLELLAPPISTTDSDATSQVTAQVRDIAHWMVLFSLKNPASNIQLNVEFHRAGDPVGTPNPTEIPSGTQLLYTVENRHSQPLYVYVLDISSDGSIDLLYPRGEQQQLSVDGKLERRFKMSVPPGRATVTDILKVIATLKPIDPSVFPQGPIRDAPQVTERGAADPLAQFLAAALRGSRAAADVTIESHSWVTVQKAVRIRQEGAKLSSFSLHFDGKKTVQDIRSHLSDSRAFCPIDEQGATPDCERLVAITEDGAVFELVPRSSTRGADGTVSVGEAFDEAYRLQEQTGARRVEPQLEIQVPGVETEQGIDKRDVSGDNTHDQAAAADDQWSLKQVRVLEAWKKIRDRLGMTEGAEADGIVIAHPDTGYRHHPETWAEIGGKRPIDAASGRNYCEGGTDAFDPLLRDRLLDNPGHGTASGSVIVSPPGCQLANASKCINGIARGAQLIPLRVHRTVSQFNTRNLSQAIQDVADGTIPRNPRVISIAMGGPPTLTMWKAVKAAEDKGILIVAAAGNYVRTVVWPARFHSTIAVAAGNVRCQPWKNSSGGPAVDIMAPGESVWRATLNERHEYINGMGKGTTFATGHVAGSAALWLSIHRDDPALRTLAEQGLLTETFRAALRVSAWRPTNSGRANPPGTQCKSATWDSNYGVGILNVAALLDVPLSGTQPRATLAGDEETVPLFASLYPRSTDPERIHADYRSLFPPARDGKGDDRSSFETEILYHYTVNEEVQRGIDALVGGQRGDEPGDSVRRALSRQDLSGRLRQALGQY
jgi:subtilisin family serine protease